MKRVTKVVGGVGYFEAEKCLLLYRQILNEQLYVIMME